MRLHRTLTALGLAVSTLTALASPDKPVIGLSLDTLKEERWQRDRDNFIAEVERLGGTVVAQSANSDDTRQVRDIESLITRGVDVLVVVPHNGEAMTRAMRSAQEAGIPVIAYDRLILNGELAAYVTFDNVKVGELQAQWVVARLPADRTARIVRIYGAPTDNNAKLFKQGQDSVINPLIASGRVKVVAEDWALDWKPENAKKIMNAAITRLGHEFDAVLVSNDGTAGGAIQSLIEEGLAGRMIVTGQDADLSACQRIMRGTQSMTVYKPVSKLATLAAQIAVAAAKGKLPEAETTLDNGFKQVPCFFEKIVAVDKANMMDTVVAAGYHPASQIR